VHRRIPTRPRSWSVSLSSPVSSAADERGRSAGSIESLRHDPDAGGLIGRARHLPATLRQMWSDL
jgi:hypothetical protein